jgi:hypothetical protein
MGHKWLHEAIGVPIRTGAKKLKGGIAVTCIPHVLKAYDTLVRSRGIHGAETI